MAVGLDMESLTCSRVQRCESGDNTFYSTLVWYGKSIEKNWRFSPDSDYMRLAVWCAHLLLEKSLHRCYLIRGCVFFVYSGITGYRSYSRWYTGVVDNRLFLHRYTYLTFLITAPFTTWSILLFIILTWFKSSHQSLNCFGGLWHRNYSIYTYGQSTVFL